MEPSSILLGTDLQYTYPGASTLRFPQISCSKGGQLLITGPSGTGKTTLLHLLSGILKIQKGEVLLAGQALSHLNQRNLDRYRGKHIGLVFQQPRFVQSLSVLGNVMASQYFGKGSSDASGAEQLLDELGILHRKEARTQELSGGERQRLNIAMALASDPDVVLADEPTSSLDDQNAARVYELLSRECAQNGAALIVVSHDQRLKKEFSDVVSL